MKRIWTMAAIGAASIGLAACDDYNEDNAYNAQDNAAYGAEEGNAAYGGDGNAAYGAGAATAATELPEGTRVVVENGVRYRVDPTGARVRIGDDESVIVVEDGVRYRIDPSGTRVRVGPDGVAIDLDDDDVDANIQLGDDPRVEVNANR